MNTNTEQWPQLTDHQINKEIAKREAAIIALKTARNTYSAISHIPDEILAQIFLIVKADSDHRNDLDRHGTGGQSSSSGRPRSTWFECLSICSHWYQIVVSTPRLWSTIDLSNPDGAVEMLRRAKTAPLRIVCTVPCAEDAPDGFWEVAEKVLSRTDRIRELDVVVREMNLCERFLSLAACPVMLMLETLKLSAPHPSLPRMQKPLPWAELPSLRVLELRRLAITADFPSLPSLTHLRIIDDAVLLSWLIRSLRSMPNVEVIEVQVIFGDARGSTGPVVALPRLRHLLFKAADFEERDIYEYFSIPSSALVEVRSTST